MISEMSATKQGACKTAGLVETWVDIRQTSALSRYI